MNLLFLSLSICMSLSAMQEHQSDEDDYEYIEFDTSAALKEDQVVPEADYCALPNLPLVILSDYCPVCQHHITLEESIILEACTKEKPGSEPHIFHKSCLQVAYAVYQECPLCHRPVDETEIFSKNIPQKVWHYSKKIVCGIPYGFIAGTTAQLTYEIGKSSIIISTQVLKSLLLATLTHHASSPRDILFSVGSSDVIIKGSSLLPTEKRTTFLLSVVEKFLKG